LLCQLRTAGLVRGERPSIRPLSGGVSSEILVVGDGTDRLVVKRALARLRVADEWFADTSRNQHEADYLEYVGTVAPEVVPKVIARGDDWFAMEYMHGFHNWKSLLLCGECHPAAAQAAGDALRRIH